MNTQISQPKGYSKDNRGKIMFGLDYSSAIEKLTINQTGKIRKNGVGLHYEERSVQKSDKKKESSVTDSIVRGEGDHYYLMSDVSEKDKYSEGYINCIGIVMVGIDKVSGRNISFMTHQDPEYFLKHMNLFKKDLKERINEIKKRAEEGSIDIKIYGGRVIDEYNFKEYKKSICSLDKIITNELGLSPEVMIGPSYNTSEPLHAYFNNKERRLHIIRKEEEDFNVFNVGYVAEKINQYIKSVQKSVEDCF